MNMTLLFELIHLFILIVQLLEQQIANVAWMIIFGDGLHNFIDVRIFIPD